MEAALISRQRGSSCQGWYALALPACETASKRLMELLNYNRFTDNMSDAIFTFQRDRYLQCYYQALPRIGDAFAPLLTMSLHYLGIAHPPMLHRQLTSPKYETFSESSLAMEDLTQDSTDVLIERLNDLVVRLSNASSLADTAITAIHSQVDKIERIIRGEERSHDEHTPQQSPGLAPPKEEDTFWGPPTPTQSLKMRLPSISPRSERKVHIIEPSMSTFKAAEIAKAAEDVASKMSRTLKALLKRKEESDVIHDLLLTRAERSTERVMFLEYRIAEIEDDVEANQSELKYLRIQLKAIEAQCNLPRNDDPELTQAIKNWKVDWEDIDRKSKARRQKCRANMTLTSSERSTLVDDT